MLYIVRFLHQTTTVINQNLVGSWLYIVRFLHQTTTLRKVNSTKLSCISSVSYIKPQPAIRPLDADEVVYRPFPTSNHNINRIRMRFSRLYIVRFLHQTTTILYKSWMILQLYIVRFLHQTTTRWHRWWHRHTLYIVRFLHQTTTTGIAVDAVAPLYIVRFLHQTTTPLILLIMGFLLYIVRFLHQTTTCREVSSHTFELYIVRFLHQTTTIMSICHSSNRLYIVRFLHQTTTPTWLWWLKDCCISSVSYIKPQLSWCIDLFVRVVYRPFPTSNHNLFACGVDVAELYIVRFLHQTTTRQREIQKILSCISSVSYIKPQPIPLNTCAPFSCISSVSYIKPQRYARG